MKLDREKVIVAAMALALVWYFKDLIPTWGESSVSPVVSRSAPLLSLNAVSYTQITLPPICSG